MDDSFLVKIGNSHNYDDCYLRGMENIIQCYHDCIIWEQQYGGVKNPESMNYINRTKSQVAIISKLFSGNSRASVTRVIRGFVRTTGGLTADFVTAGAGGDVVVNSTFAVESAMSFISSSEKLLLSLIEVKRIFSHLIKIDRSKKIPFVSRLVLDDGFQVFEKKFQTIFMQHIDKYGSDTIDYIHRKILEIMGKITTTVSDWIACLFPDTAGLAGEIAKNVLDYITKNGYTYIYNLVSILSDQMQQMITNSYSLKKFIYDAVVYLRNLIKHLNPQQISELVRAFGAKSADQFTNSLAKSAINVGTSIASNLASSYFKTYNAVKSKLAFIPTAPDMLVYILDKFIIPNINPGVDLFNQLFPIFLMFTLFIEKYPLYVSASIKHRHTITKIP